MQQRHFPVALSPSITVQLAASPGSLRVSSMSSKHRTLWLRAKSAYGGGRGMFERSIPSAASTSTRSRRSTRNWAEYNEGLRRRGDLTVWFDEEAIANWKADKTGKPGVNGSIQTWRLKRAWLSGWCTSSPTDKPKASCTRSPRSRARYRDPGLLDVVSALEVAPQEAADSESREHSTHPPDDR